jgi:hypothetical protein
MAYSTYVAALLNKPGTTEETTLESIEILARDDDEAVQKAEEQLSKSAIDDDTWIQLTKEGHGIRPEKQKRGLGRNVRFFRSGILSVPPRRPEGLPKLCCVAI